MDARDTVIGIQRTALFERCLDGLQRNGGAAGTAAKKAEEFIGAITGQDGQSLREKFSFTRHGEARIRNCRKVDLGGGFRIICLFRDGLLILLYAGSHDDCSRWLMRNRRMSFEFDEAADTEAAAPRQAPAQQNNAAVTDDAARYADEHEATLMSRIDDAVLRKVFAGLVNGRG